MKTIRLLQYMVMVATVAAVGTLPTMATSEFGFDINVVLSKKAAARLSHDKETISTIVSFSGEPKSSAKKRVNEIGLISVSPQNQWIEVSGRGGAIHVSGDNIALKTLQLVEGEISVNVNVVSGRKTNSENVLSCDFIDGKLSVVKKKSPVSLHCALIEENKETVVLP